MKRQTGFEPAPGEDALEELVVLCLARVEESGPAAIDELCRRHPESAPALRRRMDVLFRAGLVDPAAPARPTPRHLGGFTVLEPLGGGGMGVVYRARQDGLGREVALKLVRPELLDLPGTRARFRREVEAVAHLSHPNLVAVHAVGEEEGVPFLAMERVIGATLAELLVALDERDPAELRGADLASALRRRLAATGDERAVDGAAPIFAGDWIDACVAIAGDVGSALDAAHRAGVLHRDVKPSNVLLGADGRARLFDFGLALPEEADALTRTGALVGSLPYMAPEQASGELLDRRTDVYGLGATLYELLCLRPPFPHENAAALRAAILAGDPPTPRRANRRVTRDLELVIAKALDRDPDRRYAGGAELARDLVNVLERRPVDARPAGLALTLRRWARRRPALAAALAVGALAAVGTPTAVAVQRGVANRRIENALGEADAESLRAEENFEAALSALADVLGVLGDDVLRETPGMGEKAVELMERATELYGSLLPQRPDDSELVRQYARLLRQTAEALDELGREDEGRRANDHAEELFRSELAAHPESLWLRMDLADTLVDGTDPVRRRHDHEAALARYSEAEDLLDAVIAAEPVPERELFQKALAGRRQVRLNVASTLRLAGRPEEGLAALATALADAERMLEEGHPRGPYAVASVRELRATLLAELGRAGEAEGELAWVHAETVRRFASSLEVREIELFATAAINYGMVLFHASRYDELDRVVAQSLPAMEGVARAYPYVPRYRELLIELREISGLSMVARDRIDEAAPLFAENLRALAELCALSPEDRDLERSLALARHNQAVLLIEAGRRAEARAFSEQAVADFERLLSAGQALVRPYTALARVVLAQTGLTDGEYPDADALAALVEERAGAQPRAWSSLAAVLADASAHAAEDTGLPPAERDGLVEGYALAAVQALERAIDAGYDNPERIERTRELDSLRGRADFRAAVARIGD